MCIWFCVFPSQVYKWIWKNRLIRICVLLFFISFQFTLKGNVYIHITATITYNLFSYLSSACPIRWLVWKHAIKNILSFYLLHSNENWIFCIFILILKCSYCRAFSLFCYYYAIETVFLDIF